MACRFAGIDWATQKHDVLVADEAGVPANTNSNSSLRWWKCKGETRAPGSSS